MLNHQIYYGAILHFFLFLDIKKNIALKIVMHFSCFFFSVHSPLLHTEIKQIVNNTRKLFIPFICSVIIYIFFALHAARHQSISFIFIKWFKNN